MSEPLQNLPQEIVFELGFADVLERGQSHLRTPLASQLDVLRNYANLISSGMCRRPPAARGRILARLMKYVDRCLACNAPIGAKTNCPACKKMLDDFVALTQRRFAFHKDRPFRCENEDIHRAQQLAAEKQQEVRKVA